MRKNHVILLLLFGGLSLLQSCGSGQEKITTPQELVSDGQLVSLPIDSQTSNVSDGLVPFQDENGSWLFNVNHTNNEIQLYDLESKKMEKRMVFDMEGPEGVDYISGIHVQSLDSIFLFGYPTRNLHLTDTSGRINAKHKYQPPLSYLAAFVHNSHYIYTPILSGNKLLVNTKFEGDMRTIADDTLASKSLSYTIDLKSSEVNLLPMTWPKGYNASGSKLLEFSMASDGEKLVYSLVADHNLYHTDLKGNLIKTVDAKSQYVEQSFPSFNEATDRFNTMKYVFASDRYERILYDEYRGVYYRFVFPKVEVQNEEEINQLRRFPRKFAVMILDKDLNVLGETLMPENTYYPGNSFVSKDGLFISISHPDNPKNEEDLMSFEVFKLKELK
ncbi:uncharacterized protein DUF4221 [Algoriphagus ratkowskyi]|uniref:DUF4221 domain-containing protein n=1 Tax=Algoriphagus ratkowskyi TaxID=57028 RepID=A0A2W7QV86_9BACT|nr:DUF4221 family protein [Algoriphagus ratkowskyi]PZX51116.1 uncharacterized protein DUF4221 [Algoriphagus ratkowskyi]TXD75903.1 DUF4221 domain-containing protein [Algoriphagus ratkowskyi]